MKKKLLIFTLGLIIVSGVGTGIYFKTRPYAVHLHAAFKIYKDNQLLDFSNPLYMHLEPCGDKDEHHGNEVGERVHLHDNVGDIAHVHRSDATWKDLLTYLRVPLTEKIEFYTQDAKKVNLLTKPITSYEQILIVIGNNDHIEDKLKTLPTIEAVKQVEQKSEGCGLKN